MLPVFFATPAYTPCLPVQVILDRVAGRPKGYGFVAFPSAEAAAAAIGEWLCQGVFTVHWPNRPQRAHGPALTLPLCSVSARRAAGGAAHAPVAGYRCVVTNAGLGGRSVSFRAACAPTQLSPVCDLCVSAGERRTLAAGLGLGGLGGASAAPYQHQPINATSSSTTTTAASSSASLATFPFRRGEGAAMPAAARPGPGAAPTAP